MARHALHAGHGQGNSFLMLAWHVLVCMYIYPCWHDASRSGEGDNDGHDARTGIGTDRFIDTLTHLFACAHTHVFTQTCNIQKCSYTLTTHEHTYA